MRLLLVQVRGLVQFGMKKVVMPSCEASISCRFDAVEKLWRCNQKNDHINIHLKSLEHDIPYYCRAYNMLISGPSCTLEFIRAREQTVHHREVESSKKECCPGSLDKLEQYMCRRKQRLNPDMTSSVNNILEFQLCFHIGQFFWITHQKGE